MKTLPALAALALAAAAVAGAAHARQTPNEVTAQLNRAQLQGRPLYSQNPTGMQQYTGAPATNGASAYVAPAMAPNGDNQNTDTQVDDQTTATGSYHTESYTGMAPDNVTQGSTSGSSTSSGSTSSY